jgi:probable phosphomutase (TIGR03848 family)
MPTILLIRHGENDYVKEHRLPGRKPGIHLNEKGVTQAKTIAKKLKKAPIKAVYSSPLERTMETAKPIAKALNLPIIRRHGLIETDVGKWQGKKIKKLSKSKKWSKVQLIPSRFRFPGGERIVDAQQRFVEEIEYLAGQHEPGDLVVCVSHADPIKLVVAYYIGLPLDMFQRLSVSPASITALHVGDFGSRLVFLNYDVSLNFAQH